MKKFTFLLLCLILLFFLSHSNTNQEWEKQLSKYSKIYTLIKENYPAKIDKEKIFFSSIRGFLKRLDPHSYFLDPLSLRSVNEDQQGNYFGIGIRITKYEDRLTIIAPLNGTPAFKLGIMAGDIIVDIDGKNTKNLSLDQAMKMLRGAKDTIVNIKIMREGLADLINYRIKRAEIPLNSISFALTHPVASEIGFINIRTFGRTTGKEFKENMENLNKENQLKALIIDLRGNAGGSLYAAIDIVDLFLPKGKVIVSIKGKKIKQSFVSRKKNQYDNILLAVLINRGSASASEIVASALQDHKRAIILGTRSWGKGLVETVQRLSLNSAIALTTAKYYTPNNECLQRDFSEIDDYFFFFNKNYDTDKSIKGGVIPDIYVKGDFFPPIIINFISKGIFFKFSRHLIDNQYPIRRNFKADRKIIKKFKSFLQKNNHQYNDNEFNDNLKRIKIQIERDILSNKFSINEGIKVFLKSDPVIKKAVEILKEKIK